jgi:hypothetical protein
MLVALCVFGADSKRPPDLQLVEIKAQRVGDRVNLDGTVRVVGIRPLQEPALVFEFISDTKRTLTRKRAALDELILDPGDESSFRLEADCPPHAVEFRVTAFTRGERVAEVSNGGPHKIE